MSLNFNSYLSRIITIFLLITAINGAPVLGQQLVHDLKQDWVSFDKVEDGFLPVVEHDLSTEVISFKLSNEEHNQFYLTIGLHSNAYLFNRDKLIAKLEAGYSNFKIDSLKNILNDDQPFLSIYGRKLLPGLSTVVRTVPIKNASPDLYRPAKFGNSYSNFLFTTMVLLLLFFVLLRTLFPDLAAQYLLITRSVRFKTIDELIYKIPYLRTPNIFFLVFIALLIGSASISYMYFNPADLALNFINPTSAGFWKLMLAWLAISTMFFVLLVTKYLFTALMSALFALNITNVHFAASIRLLFLLAIILVVYSFIQFLIPGSLGESYIWIILLIGLLGIELILFFKLSLVTGHTLLYIIVYLCATEIIPAVILFKLYTT